MIETHPPGDLLVAQTCLHRCHLNIFINCRLSTLSAPAEAHLHLRARTQKKLHQNGNSASIPDNNRSQTVSKHNIRIFNCAATTHAVQAASKQGNFGEPCMVKLTPCARGCEANTAVEEKRECFVCFIPWENTRFRICALDDMCGPSGGSKIGSLSVLNHCPLNTPLSR